MYWITCFGNGHHPICTISIFEPMDVLIYSQYPMQENLFRLFKHCSECHDLAINVKTKSKVKMFNF